MKITSFAAAAALVAAPLSAHALLGTEVGVRGSYWIPRLTGELSVAGSGTFDLRGDLEFDDGADQGIPGAEVFVQLGDHHLSVAGSRADYGGTDDSSLKYDQLEATYQWDLIDLENWIAGTSFGPAVQLKYLDGKAKLPLGVKESFQLAVPMIGLGAHVGILADLLEARARGLWIGYRGNSAVDAFGEVIYSPFPFVDVAAGYRYIKLKVDASDMVGSSGDVTLDATQQGPYVSLTFKVGL
ncbi:MAG: hypothetical protein HZB55_21150 [Deltaproteobacteria bacterium]|nr:hypothetical protein [Deltaproteobacteria bacterium]